MPVHRQKKDTTPKTPGSRQEQTAPPLPDPQTFKQYLRELARGAMRVVLEGVMREELDALIGVGWGESSPDRKGYRNGYYTRDLVTDAIPKVVEQRTKNGAAGTGSHWCVYYIRRPFTRYDYRSGKCRIL